MWDKINYGLFHVGLVSVFLFLFGCRQRPQKRRSRFLSAMDVSAFVSGLFYFSVGLSITRFY
jgi:hypothetical protein